MKRGYVGETACLEEAALALARELGLREAKFVVHISVPREDARVYVSGAEAEVKRAGKNVK